MIDAYWCAGARVAWEGQSVYSRRGGGTRIGEEHRPARGDPLLRPGVRRAAVRAVRRRRGLRPTRPRSSTTASPLGRTDWIRDGELTALLQTRHTARDDRSSRSRPPSTTSCSTSTAAPASIDDLVAGTERGLLLTCLWYIREVDPQTLLLTGLTRDGVYLVEDGEITGAVNNFRWNESPVDLLRRFSHASATVPSFSREWGDDYFSRTATPALRVPDFNMSSVSPAQ